MTATQTVNIIASYGGSAVQGALTIAVPVVAPFKQLTSYFTFSSLGYPQEQLAIFVNPDPGNTTYTATVGPFKFLNGTLSGKSTFTFTTISSPANAFPIAGQVLTNVTGSFAFTLTQTLATGGYGIGTIGGSLLVKGTPQSGTGTVSLSSGFSGQYTATLP